MHPIEYLRYVARAGDAPPEWLIPEAAEALRGLIGDHNALVMGCRKLLEHHPRCGPMWWLCGRILGARDPYGALDDLIEAFVEDPTPLHLSLALSDVAPGTSGAPLIVEARMASATGVVAEDPIPGSVTTAGIRADAREIWVVAGIGTVVPVEIFAVVTCGETDGSTTVTTDSTARSGTLRGGGPGTVMSGTDAIDRVIRPTGVFGAEVLRAGTDVPFIPELLARG